MIGTTRKMTVSRTVLTASDRYGRARRTGRAGCSAGALALGEPAVAESGVVMDVFKFRIDIAELLADALYEGPHIGPVALDPIAGDEVLAVHEIVDLTVRDV